MYRTEEEKLTEIMLGEAVLSLVQEGKVIGWESLIAALEDMARRQKDARRRNACISAIEEVRTTASRDVPDSLKSRIIWPDPAAAENNKR